MKRRFHQLDVFTATALKGNPLAVVHDAHGLDEQQMAAFARWTNLSETAFLLPPTRPEADYRVRIFTPRTELPFAGHPTLGSCRAWLLAAGRPGNPAEVVQECALGLVRIRVDGRRLSFAAPPLQRSGPLPPDGLGRICRALALSSDDIVDHAWVDNGPGWCAVLLKSAAQVLALQPDMAVLGDLKLGVVAPQPAGHDTQFEVRAFVPGLGVPEDPVTGSLNAGLALWLMGCNRAPTQYVAAQGGCLGRAGRVHVLRQDETTWIGGDVVVCIEGEVSL